MKSIDVDKLETALYRKAFTVMCEYDTIEPSTSETQAIKTAMEWQGVIDMLFASLEVLREYAEEEDDRK